MTQAYAQSAETPVTIATTGADGAAVTGPSTTAGFISQFGALILIFAVFYFLLIRPQQKRMKKHQAMIHAVRRGDKVVTAGGLVGTVQRVESDNELLVEIADGVVVKVIKSTIADVMSKSQPSEESSDKKDKKTDKAAA